MTILLCPECKCKFDIIEPDIRDYKDPILCPLCWEIIPVYLEDRPYKPYR